MVELKIDPEFRDKIPPLTEAEFKQLEENILHDRKVHDPLVVWNKTIIDGHHRWKIIQKHPEIPFKFEKKDFADKWEAIAWMCQHQLGKRNLTEAQKTYLIGKEYEARKKTAGGNRKSSYHFGNLNGKKTAQIVADDHGIGYGTVIRAEKFTQGLDAAEKVSPGFKESVLTGELKAPKTVISNIAKMDQQEQKKTIEAIQKGERMFASKTEPKPTITDEPEEPQISEYTVDDLKLELDCVVDVFERNFKSTLVVHSAMMGNETAKQKALDSLQEAEKAIQKLRRLIHE